MIVVMRAGAAPEEIEAVTDHIRGMGFRPHLSEGEERTIVGVIGNERRVEPDELSWLAGVERVVPILAPYKLASRDFHPAPTVVRLDNGVEIGGPAQVLIAGPCSVESQAQTFEVAAALHALGVRVLRGGAFKPRTSPYAFQGLGEPALRILAEVRDTFGLAIVTEVMGSDEVELVGAYADVLQVGARNMQNYRLLEAVGRQSRPVLLKRAPSATTEELLLAAEYILAQGNGQVLLCERGIRSYDPLVRNTFDLNAVPLLKLLTHLPVIADPSHGTGRRDLVGAVSRAALAAGADGLIVEVHAHPETALSDGAQSLRPSDVAALVPGLSLAAAAADRVFALAPSERAEPVLAAV